MCSRRSSSRARRAARRSCTSGIASAPDERRRAARTWRGAAYNPVPMSIPAQRAADGLDLTALEAITDAVESGAGLPEVIRAAARALDASLVLLDRGGTVLAAAARSPAAERSLVTGGAGVETLDLRVADEPVGALRMRARSDPGAALLRLVTTLVASEGVGAGSARGGPCRPLVPRSSPPRGGPVGPPSAPPSRRWPASSGRSWPA